MPCTSLSVLSDTLTRNLTHVKYAQRLAEDLVSPPPVSPESFNRRRQQQERHQNIYSSSTMEPFEKTYAMIKPDAVAAGKAEEICQLIEVHGFTVVSKQKLQVRRLLVDVPFAVSMWSFSGACFTLSATVRGLTGCLLSHYTVCHNIFAQRKLAWCSSHHKGLRISMQSTRASPFSRHWSTS